MKQFKFARRALGMCALALVAVFVLSPVTALAAQPSANTTFSGTAKNGGHTAGTVTATTKSSRKTLTVISFAKMSVCLTSSISFTNVKVKSSGKFAADFNGIYLSGKFTSKHQATGTLKWTINCTAKLTFTIYAQPN